MFVSKIRAAQVALVLAALLASLPALAAEPARVLRAGAVYLMPMERTQDTQGLVTTRFEPDDAIAPFVAFAIPLKQEDGKWSAEFSVWTTTFDIDGLESETIINPDFTRDVIETPFEGEITVTPITAGLNYHASRSDRWDIYIGAYLLYALMDDLEVSSEAGSGSVSIENDLSWGALVGLDFIPKNDSKWRLTSSIRYTFIDAEFSESGTDNFAFEIDPLSVQAGIGYQF